MAALASFTLPRPATASRGLRAGALVTGFVALYALVWIGWSVAHGYGFDDDAYSTVRVWQQLLAEHVYVPSRFQGSLLAELPLGSAAWLLGSAGSNLVVALCTAAGLFAFWRTLALYGIGARGLAIAAVLANGYVLIAAGTSMDYMVAFGVFALGLWALAAGEDVLGVVLLGASAGARIFYVSLAEVTILFVLLERRRAGAPGATGLAHLAACMACAFFVAGLFYLTIWLQHGLGLSWLSAARPTDQGAAGLLARWAYKSVMFVGPPGLALAAAGWAVADRRAATPLGRGARAGRAGAFALYALVVVALHLLLFAWIPIDASYLIPALPFAAAVLAALGWRGALAGLALGELVSTLVVVDPLSVSHPARDVCMRSHASGVALRPHLAPGLLVEDARHRALATRCGEQVLLIRPVTPTAPLPTQRPGDHGVVYPPTPPIETAPDW